MAQEEKLPWEMVEEILSRVPPTSLVRFRIVSKRWNARFDDEKFINNHKATFRFILATESKVYSVSVDPKIVVHELALDIPGLAFQKPKKLVDCNEFILCRMEKGAVVWNPWLKQTRCIEPDVNQPSLECQGIGYKYDNRSLGYKTLACYRKSLDDFTRWKVHDYASDEWKDIPSSGSRSSQGKKCCKLHTSRCVLNGILYFIAFYDMTDPLYQLRKFDFSSQKFAKFCELPCGANHECDALVHKVFKGDRFSLLKQCHKTKKLEIWVTKNKINHEDGDNVVWTNFMILSIPNFPGLVPTEFYLQPSYFINDDIRLVLCSCDDAGRAWIYVAEDNKLISKMCIDSVVDPWPLHCTYTPSLIPVPPGKREEEESQPEQISRAV